MRVIHVITRLILGGAQENTLATVTGLRSRHDLDVTMISGPTEGSEGSLEAQAKAVPGMLTVIPSLVRPVQPWMDLSSVVSLFRRFRAARPHVVHTHSGKAGIVGRVAAWAAGVPVVVHGIHGPSFGAFQGATANAVFLTAERLAGRMTSHFVVVAQAMARQYLAAGIGHPDQYTRVFSGFDLAPYLAVDRSEALRRQLGWGAEHFVVGKIARLFELKGHEDLIAAAPSMVRDNPNVRFLLVGDGPWRVALEEEVRNRGLSSHVHFAGLVPPASVPEYLGVMDLLVHLSRREGLARALPQALAAGRPVLAYDCDGANEVCLNGRTGFLIPVGNIHALRDRVRLLAKDPRLRREFGERGREMVRELFPVDRMVDDQYELYRRLCLEAA
ncbi:MAG: glycosyltransferase family 4 protein [Verrucomicrobiales bacterium]|nr:glycosyltransferase family 4 protein [Verrucomicrobiales bacterium]